MGNETDNTMVLTVGINNTRKDSGTIRTFVWCVSPTDTESSFSDAPVRKVNSRKDWNTGLISTLYNVTNNFRMKFFTSQSKLGKLKKAVHIYLNVGKKHHLITFRGFEESGEFEGRAEIYAVVIENKLYKPDTPIAREILKELEYRVLQEGLGKKETSPYARKLII